jgi:excisionase family DNA binding protein
MPSTAAPEQFFTVAETADRWKVHERTVRRLIASGDLKVVRVRSAIRIRGSELEKFLAREGAGEEANE